jgi:hypothetical protein
MCDHSLHHVASRPAKAGDELVTRKFRNTITRGFSPVGEPNVAVCLLPGTEITFEKEAEHGNPLVRLFPALGFGKLIGKLARFRQINLDNPLTHHDALEFADGKTVLLTLLRPGQRATVLQLPAQHRPSIAIEPTSSKARSCEERLALIS